MDLVVLEKTDQPGVLVRRKRGRHHHAFQPQLTTGVHHRGQYRGGGNRRDLPHGRQDLAIRAGAFVGQEQLAGDHEEVEGEFGQLPDQAEKLTFRPGELLVREFAHPESAALHRDVRRQDPVDVGKHLFTHVG